MNGPLKQKRRTTGGEKEGEAESTVIMFGLGLPAGSFPLRSQQESEECRMRREKKRRGEENRGG